LTYACNRNLNVFTKVKIDAVAILFGFLCYYNVTFIQCQNFQFYFPLFYCFSMISLTI
jgi:hypothetical protein